LNFFTKLSKLKIQDNSSKIAFVIATGPSLNGVDFEKIKGNDIYSVSNAFLNPEVIRLKPLMHFFTPYHKPLILSNYIDWLSESDKILPQETIICLSSKDKYIIEQFQLFKTRKVVYIKFGNPFNFSNIRFPIATPLTSPQMVMPLLIGLKYSNIVLLGCDHNTLKDYGKPRQHFYEAAKDKRINVNDWVGIIHHLISELIMFMYYYRLKVVANKFDVNLLNASRESWLDFFEYTSKYDKVEL
jgi:hypothetical protein